MSKPIVEIDIDDLKEHLYLDGKMLYRHNNPSKSLNHQKMVRVGEDRVYTSRAIYALANDRPPIDYLLINEDGDFVEVSDSIRQMFAYRGYSKSSKKGSRFTARWFTLDGHRSSKTFNSMEAAEFHQREMVNIVWGDKLKKLKLYHLYFNS